MNEQKDKILVSVITVSYNSQETIKDTIESVLAQNYGNIEYIIVDGASKDKTVEIAESYKEQFEHKGYTYRIISEEDNGIYDAMNKGIRLSTGELIGIINSDDWYEPCAVETAVKVYEEKQCDLMYGNIRIVREDGSSFIKESKSDRFPTSRHWNHPTMFTSKELYERLGVYRCEGIHDDFDFFLRARRSGSRVAIENTVMADFRMGGTSNDRSWKKSKQRIKDRYRCYRNNGYSRLYILECLAMEAAKSLMK